MLLVPTRPARLDTAAEVDVGAIWYLICELAGQAIAELAWSRIQRPVTRAIERLHVLGLAAVWLAGLLLLRLAWRIGTNGGGETSFAVAVGLWLVVPLVVLLVTGQWMTVHRKRSGWKRSRRSR